MQKIELITIIINISLNIIPREEEVVVVDIFMKTIILVVEFEVDIREEEVVSWVIKIVIMSTTLEDHITREVITGEIILQDMAIERNTIVVVVDIEEEGGEEATDKIIVSTNKIWIVQISIINNTTNLISNTNCRDKS